ncbi:MAG: PadR family transcriptional regulator [Candidatus Omnitrophica bacterium]|nr:PadR family transcriptional regulator [Candidatus Omnitrophota bacterium]
MLSPFIGVETESIYYPLRILEKKGLLTKKSAKAGKRPQRFVYEITEKGQKRFLELLNSSFLDFKRPHFSLDLSLYFLHYVKSEVAIRRLRARIQILNKLAASLEQTAAAIDNKKTSAVVSSILRHNLNMVIAEANFLSELIKSL